MEIAQKVTDSKPTHDKVEKADENCLNDYLFEAVISKNRFNFVTVSLWF